MNSIDLNAQCQASFTVSPDSNNVGNFFFQNTSSANYNYAYWSFGDGTSSYQTNPYHSYNATGNFIVCLTIGDSTSGCQSTTCDTLVVGTAFPTCNANFSTSVSGLSATFTNSSTSSSGIITNYYWAFGDGSTSTGTNPNHTYATAGNYSVCLTMIDSSSGCSDQTCKPVTVTSTQNCNAAFYVNDTGSVVILSPIYCTPNTATFLWNFGDGTTSTSYQPHHIYPQPGTYIACLTITTFLNSCTNTYCDTVNYQPNISTCQTQFTYLCMINNQVSFSLANPNSAIISYAWNFGDSTNVDSSSNPTHTFASAGSYTVCLTIQTSLGCTYTTCQLVAVGNVALCNATFTPYDSAGFVYFVPSVINNSLYYYWTFGDGSTSTQSLPIHQYIGNGPWTACLTIIDSMQMCSDQYCAVITNPVSGPCASSFVYTTNPGTTLAAFANTSTGNYTNYSWSFGDGTSSTSANPSHTYSSQGTFLACLTVYNNNSGCQSSFCDSVVIGNGQTNQCVPVFYSYPDSSFIGSGIVYFGIINSCPGSTYTWSVNGTQFGTGTNPLIQFPDSGWYYICVTGITPNGTYVTCDSVYSYRMAGPTGINENGNQIPINVSPNPSNGPLTISFQLAQSETVTIQLITIDGRELLSQQEKLNSGVHHQIISTENIAAGLYLIRLQAGGKQSISRIAVQH